MRIFAISDLHVDYPENARWVENLSLVDYQNDVLILAGDVSDLPKHLAHTLESLVRRFSKVLYVPGNHELWVQRCGYKNSYSKFDYLKRLTQKIGVSMEPYHINGVSVVPLFSWYDYSFGKPDDKLLSRWMDYHFCDWQGHADQEVTKFFIDLNIPQLKQDSQFIISFSHFLPRIDTMPSYIPPKHRMVYPVLGSSLLEDQIRTLGSKIHVYGHSHVNRSVEKEGTLYVNAAFGGPSESRISAKALYCVHQF